MINNIHIFHHNDADGRASAAIICDVYDHDERHIVCHEIDYKDIPDFNSISKNDKVFIVDFSFKPEYMTILLNITNDIVWCDHHKTAEKYGYIIDGIRDFSEKGRAGCEVTWDWCYSGGKHPEWLTLLGDYDAWRMNLSPKSLVFYEGLKLYDQAPSSTHSVFRGLISGKIAIDDVVESGRCAIKYRDLYCSEMRTQFGYFTNISGHKAFACNIYRFGSPGFGDMFDSVPICASYAHDGLKFTVSLYSTSVDVGEICKALGGGGHKGAAGFVCESLPWEISKEVV